MAAAEVPAAREEGISGTGTQQQSTKTTSGVGALLIAKKKFYMVLQFYTSRSAQHRDQLYIYILTSTASFPLILEGCVINCSKIFFIVLHLKHFSGFNQSFDAC